MKKETLQAFRDTGLGERAFKGIEDAHKWLESQEPPKRLIMCPYTSEYRFIHPEVCSEHKKRQDPECFTCKPVNEGRVVETSLFGPYVMMKNESLYWDPADLPDGKYVWGGKAGWKRK